MLTKQLHFKKWPACTALTTFFCLGSLASAQSMPAQNPAQGDNSRTTQDRDNDSNRREVSSFYQFLTDHPQIADKLRGSPSSATDPQYLQDHPELQTYLQNHPEVAQQLKQNPDGFMQQEERLANYRDANLTSREANEPATKREVASFYNFLSSHPQIADKLRGDPSEANDPTYLKAHPELQAYLQDNPGVRHDLQQHPDGFMVDEENYAKNPNASSTTTGNGATTSSRDNDRDRDRGQSATTPSTNSDRDMNRRDNGQTATQTADNNDRDRDMDRRDNDANRRQLSSFDQFLDSHREISEQLRKDPSLVDNSQFLKSHPALQTYLQQHPEVRQQLQQNPNAFMQQENRYDRFEDSRFRQDNQRELGRFDQFLDGHREIGEQLRKNPSLVNDPQFVKSHPALQSYLQQNPGASQALKQDPNAFMQQEARYERNGNEMNRGGNTNMGMDRDDMARRTRSASFGQFLGQHSDLNDKLSKDPSQVKDKEFMQQHPELQSYLSSHPDVRDELMADPQNFVKAAQQNGTTGTGTGTKTTTTPGATTSPSTNPTTAQPKPPKQ